MQAALREQLEQIQQRVARELGRARLAGDVLPGAYFDCAAELAPLFDTLHMIHRRGLHLHWHTHEDCRLPWDREDMLELLGNLLDNACKYARSEVLLSIEPTPEGYLIRVEDDGPGIPEDQREAVLERGTRLDERAEGHGLGLGIVRDILAAWNGRLTLGQSALGGLQASVHLPAHKRRAE